MGEAKRRGDFNERKAQSIARKVHDIARRIESETKIEVAEKGRPTKKAIVHTLLAALAMANRQEWNKA